AGLRVVLHPARAAVGGRVDAPNADAHLHPLGIARVDRDRVKTHAAKAWHPLRACRLIVERLIELPGLATVLALPERGRLGARPQDVRRLRVSGLDVPGLEEGAIGALGERGVLRCLPGLAEIAAALDPRSTPGGVERGVHRAVSRVVAGVVDLRRRLARTIDRPFPS